MSYANIKTTEDGYIVCAFGITVHRANGRVFPADLFTTNITVFLKARDLTFLKWTHINQTPETDVHT